MSNTEWYRLPTERGPVEATRIYLQRLRILFVASGIALAIYATLWLFVAPLALQLLIGAGGVAAALLTQKRYRHLFQREKQAFNESQSDEGEALESERHMRTLHEAESSAREAIDRQRRALLNEVKSRVRVALDVEDAPMRIALLNELESEAIGVVGATSSFLEAADLVVESSPNVLIMDVKMPGSLARDALRSIAHDHPEVAVVMLTASEDPRVAADVVHAGARGYLLRNHMDSELVETLIRVASGRTVIDPHIIVPIATELLGRGRDLGTLRELEIVRLLAAGNSPRDVADQLYVSPEIVRTHMLRIAEAFYRSDQGAAIADALRIASQTDLE